MRERLTVKEENALRILDKLGVADAGVVAELSGGGDISVMRKRLSRLKAGSYVDCLLYDGRKVYFDTAKGLAAIGSWRKPYRGRSGTTWHAICIGIVAAWICGEFEVGIEEIETDRTLPKKSKHLPDLVTADVAIEVELTQKSKKRLEENLLSNGVSYSSQMWVVPKERRSMIKEVVRVAKEYGFEIYIYYLGDVEQAVRSRSFRKKYSYIYTKGEVEGLV